MPEIFAKKNQYGAPYFGILVSSLVIAVLLVLTANKSLTKQINFIIDISVSSFLFVYLFCALAFVKLKMTENNLTIPSFFYGVGSAVFCLWVICQTPLFTLLMASLFAFSGIPMYCIWCENNAVHR